MSNYLMKYKGTYRLRCELDETTNDFPRDDQGNIIDNDVYIQCANDVKVFLYGRFDHKRPVWLTVYIPSLIRGHNILSKIPSGVEIRNVEETRTEIMFLFKAEDIEQVIPILKPRTYGADISPFSNKNLPSRKDIKIPDNEIEIYKATIAEIYDGGLLCISHFTKSFLNDFVQKKQKRINKSFNVVADMKKQCLARQSKEYIWIMGYWKDYLKYLKKNIAEANKNYEIPIS